MTTTDRPHGYARYKLDGCRCYTCGFTNSQYEENRQKAIRRGTWQPYVSAEPTRQHILQLKHGGVGDRTIARLAHIDRKRIRDILHGRPERDTGPLEKIRPATAAAILSVELTLDVLPANLHINSAGTQRRLQALARNGWPGAQLGARLGMTRAGYSQLLQQEQVTAAKARAIRALYNELWRADPRDHGVTLQPYNRAVNHAKASGWAPVGAWDDDTIDDPAAAPEWTGYCGTTKGYRAHYDTGLRPACPACRAANAADSLARRQAA